jgi:deoxyribose-phosphate aldolase
MDPARIASRIDHTLLKAEATAGEIAALVSEARQHHFAAVCVNPVFVHTVKAGLAGSGIRACTVVGFPLGANTALTKAKEAADAVEQGADEVDIVAHLPNLLAGDYDAIHGELIEVVTSVQYARTDVIIKVIVESALLMAGVDEAEAERRIASACKAVHDAGCDFIKTSTGFHPAGGATVAAVSLMKKHGRGLKIKASGGIRTYHDAVRLIDAGADRLGCSASVAIITGGYSRAEY